MQSKNVVTSLPNFRTNDMQKVCEACQFGKQARHAFPQERNVSSKLLDVIHFDVWGPTKHASMLGSKFNVTFLALQAVQNYGREGNKSID